jgi:hypothetical protein
MKRKEYRETYSLTQNAPYQIDDDAYKGTPWSGGVLNAGRWSIWGSVRIRTTEYGKQVKTVKANNLP